LRGGGLRGFKLTEVGVVFCSGRRVTDLLHVLIEELLELGLLKSRSELLGFFAAHIQLLQLLMHRARATAISACHGDRNHR